MLQPFNANAGYFLCEFCQALDWEAVCLSISTLSVPAESVPGNKVGWKQMCLV